MSDLYTFTDQMLTRVEARRAALAEEALGGNLALEDYKAVCRARHELSLIAGELAETRSALIATSNARLVPRGTPEPVVDFSGRPIGRDSYGSAA